MSDRTRLEAQIIAIDKASPVFAQVANGAQKMGTAVTNSAKQSSQALKENEQAINNVKIGVAALGGAFALASRASMDQARQIDAINRLYGESADQILDLSEAIQDNTNFSNDAARQAAITGSTLASNYELSAEQIGVLIERSADLAQIHGIDLADAMSRVSGAIRGEGEAAELLGLNMSDAAVAAEAAARGLTGWNTTMTEAEKAAFRYVLVLEQTTATQGAAADAADTTSGRVRQLANEVQDAAQQFAAWTGPVGESVAVLSDYALQTGLALAGVTKLAQGLHGLGAASKVASLAMGPAGLVLAAGAATAALYVLLTQTSDLEKVQNASADATTDFANELAKLGVTGSAAAQDFAQVKDLFGELLALQEDIHKMEAAGGGQTGGSVDAMSAGEIEDIKDAILELFNNPFVDTAKVTARLRELFGEFRQGDIDSDELRDSIVQMSEAWSQYAGETEKVGKAQDKVADSSVKLKDAIKGVTDSLRSPVLSASAEGSMGELARNIEAIGEATGQAGDIARQRAVALGDQLEANTITLDQYKDGIEGIAAPFRELADMQAKFASNFTTSMDEVQAVLDRFANRMDGTALSFEELSQAADDASLDLTDFAGDGLSTAAIMVKLSQSSQAAADAIGESETALERMARGSTSAGVALKAFKEVQDGIIASQDPFNNQLSEYNTQLGYIENAVDILNQRREDGIALSAEEEDLLNRAGAAQERLQGGAEDATIALAQQAVTYAENMKLGDSLNSTLSGTNDAVNNLTGAVQMLTATLQVLGDTDAEPSVAISGLDFATTGLADVAHLLDVIDGTVASATVNVGSNIDPALGALPFRHGGVVPYVEARHGYVSGGMTAIGVGEAGRETLFVPGGSYVRNAAATAASGSGRGGMNVYLSIGEVRTSKDLDDFISEAARAVSARFASFGLGG